MMLDAQMLHKRKGHIDIKLLSVGHENADDPVHAQSLHAERCHHRRILAAGNANNGVAIGAVFGKVVPNPLNDFLTDLVYIKGFHTNASKKLPCPSLNRGRLRFT